MTGSVKIAESPEAPRGILQQALEHAQEALRLIDQSAPNTILGVRCQHLIDELEQALDT